MKTIEEMYQEVKFDIGKSFTLIELAIATSSTEFYRLLNDKKYETKILKLEEQRRKYIEKNKDDWADKAVDLARDQELD